MLRLQDAIRNTQKRSRKRLSRKELQAVVVLFRANRVKAKLKPWKHL